MGEFQYFLEILCPVLRSVGWLFGLFLQPFWVFIYPNLPDMNILLNLKRRILRIRMQFLHIKFGCLINICYFCR